MACGKAEDVGRLTPAKDCKGDFDSYYQLILQSYPNIGADPQGWVCP